MKRMLVAVAMACMTGCGGAPVDIAKAVDAKVVTSGWLPAEASGGRNKNVPAIAVTLKNVSGATLNALQLNAVFRLVSSNDELASDFRPIAGPSGLPAGGSTGKIALKASRGYTGTDPVDDLLRNSKFVDAKVELFVKAGSGQWTRVGEFPIARQFTGN